MSDVTRDVRIGLIRHRHQTRIDSGLIGGVQEWTEIAFLLNVIDELMAEPIEYEYAVKRNSLVRPELVFTVGDYWGDYDERLKALREFQEHTGRGSKIKYALARRRKVSLEEVFMNELDNSSELS